MDTARKRPERPWTAARTMEVLRRCPLAIAQRLVHCTTAVSMPCLGRVTRTMSVALCAELVSSWILMSASVGSPQDEQHCFKSHVYRGVPWGPFIFLTQTDLIDYASVACDNKQGNLQYYISCKYDMGNYLTQGNRSRIGGRGGGGGQRSSKSR